MVNAGRDQVEEAIVVTSDDKKAEKPEKDKEKLVSDKEKTELPEEDKKLQEDLQMLIDRLTEPNQGLYGQALESMRSIIRCSTTSMTSVPKPLKYMIPHYPKMKEIFEKITDAQTKRHCADIISVLAMCSDDEDQQDCVHFRLKGAAEDIGAWGHEYVRHLCKGVVEEWRKCQEGTTSNAEEVKQKLLGLVREISLYNLKHNAEVEACDLLIEIEQLSLLLDDSFSSELDFARVCLYLLSCVPYLPFPENQSLIKCASDIYLRFGRHFEALRCAVMLNDTDLITKIFTECPERLTQKQMAILLGRHQIFLEIEDDTLAELNANTHLHAHFLSICRELDIMAPKSPEDIYKSHLEQRIYQTPATDIPRQNLASTFVNGFVNCGFGTDSILEKDQKSAAEWYQKNAEYGAFSAAASLGLIHRWDVDNGLTKCDPFLYGTSDYVQAGTLLAIGIVFSGIQDPVDPACALLQDRLQDSKSTVTRVGATLGLGLAYANSKRNTVVVGDGCVAAELRKVLNDTSPLATAEVKGLAALSLGLILVGTSNDEVALELLTYLMEGGADFKDPNTRFIALGIALIYLGSQERSEVIVDAVKALPDPFGSMTSTLVDVCAYSGTGNVLKIQSLLHICSEHYGGFKKEEPPRTPKNQTPVKGASLDITAAPVPSVQNAAEQASAEAANAEALAELSTRQAVAALGIGLIAMGDSVGSQMSLRMFGHLTRYSEVPIRRAVPLAIALTSISNPQLTIMETLAKYSRDNDNETARNAIFALGLIGAGTNNARLVALLRQLASYHSKDTQTMMLIRIAQGLIHLGKGTMTMNPFHSDRQLMSPAAVAALFSICFAFLDAERTILNRQHYLLYTLVVAIQPRMMLTLVEDEEDGEMERRLVQKPVQVRVGQAVDVVAQAGQPRAITGFQTHTTPVLLAYGERAELATDDYDSITSVLEGLVILKKKENTEGTVNGIKK